MTKNKKAALVIAPGRGSYNQTELGYFKRLHADRLNLLKSFDDWRHKQGQDSLLKLDGAAQFHPAIHTRGDYASGLIYACSYADFLRIDRDIFDIVAVTGNSMGWYTALACSGALTDETGFRVVNTMGTIMHAHLDGGQILYPFVDDDWRAVAATRTMLLGLVDEIDGLHVSIDLGGMMVLAGSEIALQTAQARLPSIRETYPMPLANHAAFHTPLMSANAQRGQAALPVSLFGQPSIAMIDGRGHVWLPQACDLSALWHYTLATQIIETYDFTKAVTHALHEFAPDSVIILGPGATLGGAVAQAMIASNWRGLSSKADFIDAQKTDPVILSMGMAAQRAVAIGQSA